MLLFFWWVFQRANRIRRQVSVIKYQKKQNHPFSSIMHNMLCFSSRPQTHKCTTNPNPSKFAQKFGGSEKCSRCEKSVYAAEKIVGAGKVAEAAESPIPPSLLSIMHVFVVTNAKNSRKDTYTNNFVHKDPPHTHDFWDFPLWARLTDFILGPNPFLGKSSFPFTPLHQPGFTASLWPSCKS